jgi:hypothetical protein
MNEHIDRVISEINAEADRFVLYKSFQIMRFVNSKRTAFVEALNQARSNLITTYEQSKKIQPELNKYFFRFQIENFKPTPANHKYVLGYLYIVKDGYLDAEAFTKANAFTNQIFNHTEFKLEYPPVFYLNKFI